MDRYLLTGAFALLILEVYVLFSDLNGLNIKDFQQKNANQYVGQVIQTRESVRRKQNDSIAWQDTQVNQNLQAYDSILTLDQSSAQIKLHGDIQITLHENTLIVLEPLEDEEDSPSINFNEGLILSKIKQKSLKLGARNWTIEAKPGTDLSLKSLNEDKLEIEVKSGEIELANLHTKEKQKITKDSIIQTSATGIETHEAISEQLKWSTTIYRVYSHIFPLNYKLVWQGEASEITIEDQNKLSSTVDVNGYQSMDYLAYPGTYSFRLKNEDQKSSEKLIVEVLEAPIIQYYSPLPRERFITGSEMYFNWTPLRNVNSYELEFSETEEFYEKYKKVVSQKNSVSLALDQEHKLYWQVKAFDENNYIIPPLYRYKLYTADDPFAAPKIKMVKVKKATKPKKNNIETRGPATDKQKKEKINKPTLINKLWNLLLPRVYAEEAPYREVKFEWEAIDGADFYMLEVSSNPNFLNPEINQRVYKNHFVWRESFKHENYYIRVAAGDEEGRIGLFSSPQLINLKEVETIARPTEAKILSEDELKKLTPIDYDEASMQKLEENRVKFEDLDITSSINSSYVEPDFLLQVSLAANYQLSTVEVDNDYKSQHQGLIPFSTNIYVQAQKWISNLEVQYVQWSVEKSDYPFQKDLESLNAQFQSHFRWTKTQALGLSYSKKALPTREDYEELVLKDQDFIGVSYMYNVYRNSWSSLSHLNIETSGAGQLYSLGNKTYWRLASHPWQFLLGGQIKLQYLNAGETKGNYIEPGLFLGIEW